MRPITLAILLGISLIGVNASFAQQNGWNSAGTYGHRATSKTPHLNGAKETSKVTGAKVRRGTPSGASSGDANTTSGAHGSGPNSHPLHGAGSDQWH
jgi:hypothetical protein